MKNKWYIKEWDEAKERINQRIQLGLRPHIHDQLILGTRYDMIEKWFENVQHSYGIHYIVMQKEKIKKQYVFPIAFENKHFVVFKLPALSHKSIN